MSLLKYPNETYKTNETFLIIEKKTLKIYKKNFYAGTLTKAMRR